MNTRRRRIRGAVCFLVGMGVAVAAAIERGQAKPRAAGPPPEAIAVGGLNIPQRIAARGDVVAVVVGGLLIVWTPFLVGWWRVGVWKLRRLPRETRVVLRPFWAALAASDYGSARTVLVTLPPDIPTRILLEAGVAALERQDAGLRYELEETLAEILRGYMKPVARLETAGGTAVNIGLFGAGAGVASSLVHGSQGGIDGALTFEFVKPYALGGSC